MTHVSNSDFVILNGWKITKHGSGWMVINQFGGGGYTDDKEKICPDLIHDLNLVHEIEAGLPEMERTHYLNLLANEVVENDDDNMGVGFDSLSYIGSFMVVCATAQQRCNALFPILQERSKG